MPRLHVSGARRSALCAGVEEGAEYPTGYPRGDCVTTGSKEGHNGRNFHSAGTVFYLLKGLPGPREALPTTSNYTSIPSTSATIPTGREDPIRRRRCARATPSFPSSAALSVFFFLPRFLLVRLLFFLLILFRSFLRGLLHRGPVLRFHFNLTMLYVKTFLSFRGR